MGLDEITDNGESQTCPRAGLVQPTPARKGERFALLDSAAGPVIVVLIPICPGKRWQQDCGESEGENGASGLLAHARKIHIRT